MFTRDEAGKAGLNCEILLINLRDERSGKKMQAMVEAFVLVAQVYVVKVDVVLVAKVVVGESLN